MRSPTPGCALEARLEEARRRWGLTPRHVSIVRLLARGDPNKEVATKLGLSVGTVEMNITEILRRGKVESRLQLVAKLWK
jgi:DNA-binding NarL/FixJ family response regulator